MSSVFPFEKVRKLIETAKSSYGATRTNALKELWNLSDINHYKEYFLEPRLSFASTLVEILRDPGIELESILNAVSCVWYLSREIKCRERMCSEIELVVAMMAVIDRSVAIKKAVLCALANCSIDPNSHPYLLSSRVGYLEYLKTDIIRNYDNSFCYQSVYCFTSYMNRSDCLTINGFGLTELMYQKLFTYGTSVSRWNMRFNGPAYWCLNMIMNASKFPEGADLIRSFPDSTGFFTAILATEDVESIKSAFILANLHGSNEGNSTTKALLETYPRVLELVGKIMIATMDFDESRSDIKDLSRRGFAYGIIRFPDISAALKNLSLSEKNKRVILANKRILSSVLDVIRSFIWNAPEYAARSGVAVELAGGGGGDVWTLQNFLELLLQLSFCFESSVALHREFSQINEHNIPKLLQMILELPDERATPPQIRQLVFTLLVRYNPLLAEKVLSSSTVESPSSTVTDLSYAVSSMSITSKHIMISYAPGKNEQMVEFLTSKLRESGYDVWRNVSGSSIVSAVTNDFSTTVDDAIRHADAVIVCISREYKDSASCRAEIQKAKGLGIQLLFVMLDESYHTRSKVPIDGWIGSIVGSNTWFPLWDPMLLNPTVGSLAGLLGERGKIAKHATINLEETSTASSTAPAPAVDDVIVPPPAPVQTISKMPGGNPDFDTAWSCLEGRKSLYPKGLEGILEDLGVYEVNDLKMLETQQLELLSLLLKPVQRKIFVNAMCL
jgi:hypothetical protein